MKKGTIWSAVFGAAALALVGGLATGQIATLPYLSTVNPTDAIQDIPLGAPGVSNQYVSVNQLSGALGVGAPSRGNALIGGDATTNLWQRATTGATQTTTVAYGGPDRWAYWSGTSTGMKVSRDSTAADLPTGYQYAFKMLRNSGVAGVVQMCMAQEVASANSYQFAGSTAELDFHATTGANYSGGTSLTAYIIYGTSTDEGITNLAFGLNGGGGGASAWTGQTNATAAVIPLTAVSTTGRFGAIASIPATATEIAVALCYTPSGTAGTNDYVAFAGIQLVRNSLNANYVNSATGYNAASANAPTLVAFERRPAAIEAYYQYTYYQQWADNLAATFTLPMTCTETTSGTTAACLFTFPIPMRTTTPTVTIATSASFGMTKVADGTAEACTAFAVVASTNTANNFKATCAASETAAVGTMHIGLYANTGAANTLTVSSEL